MSNYRDPDSGWTFIEEQDISALLYESLTMLWMCILVVLVSSLLIAALAYIRVRKATTIITELSRQIGNKSADDLSLLPVADTYEETYTLSTTFNGMLERIQNMIGDIQRHEQEKRKTEYDLWIRVSDNGDGMSVERLSQINTWAYSSEKTHHGIGVKNIRQRLKIIYGDDSDLEVHSIQGVSTTITMVIAGCRKRHDLGLAREGEIANESAGG